MAHILGDRVKETTTTTGTGTLALAGAVSQFRAFSSVMANGDTTLYAIVGQTGTEWEVGVGTWSTGNNLARTTILSSSNAGAVVTLSSGTKDVFILLTTGGEWPGLKLSTGAVVDWAAGDVTLTHSSQHLTLAGGTLIVAAGTTTDPGFQIQVGTLLTTPEVGTFEMDATNYYGTSDAGNRGIIPIAHYIRAASAQTLTSTASAQAIFDSPANGRITLETGAYYFNMVVRFTGMSATTGNGQILFGGTGTFADWLWWHSALDNTTPANIAADLVGLAVTNASPALVATTGTGTALRVKAEGTFECSAGGTWIPQIALTTAAAATVTAGSYCRVERIGAAATASVGQWD